MSTDELQSNGFGVNGHNHAAAPPDVTIKFFGSDVEIEGHKAALIAGSAFFTNHFLQHPSSTKITAPKAIRPGETISLDIVQTAIDYLHGKDIPEKYIANNDIPLLLAAKAFGILSLEERVKNYLTNKLDHQFELITREIQILELVDALRDLYGRLGGEGDVEVGREVAGIVTGAAAHACCRGFPVLKKSPEFMRLLKEIPVLAYDILASDAEVLTGAENGDSLAESEELVKSSEGLSEVVTEEVATDFVKAVVADGAEVIAEEAVEEVVQPVEE